MKTVTYIIVFATTLILTPSTHGQLTPEQVSARIRAHIPSSSTNSQSNQQSNGEEELESSGWDFAPLASFYGSGDLWLDVPVITNDLVSLTLHNTQSNLYCQLLTNTDLRFPKIWNYGQIVHATNDTTLFVPEPMFGRDRTFYRAVEGFPIVAILPQGDAIEPTNAFSGQSGFFVVELSDPLTNDLTIYYKISGSAENGTDYTNIASLPPIVESRSKTREAISQIFLATNSDRSRTVGSRIDHVTTN